MRPQLKDSKSHDRSKVDLESPNFKFPLKFADSKSSFGRGKN